MQIQTIETGVFRLDGGAMFGVVPKTLWARQSPPDANNLCTWSMRCLLVRTGQRNILIDTGIGVKQDDTFRRHFLPEGQSAFLPNLLSAGLTPEEITDVLLTHLHFDHVGGALQRSENGTFIPTFPNATYWTNSRHLKWATRPNAREAASFLPENFLPLQALGCLRFVEPAKEDVEWLPGITLRFVYGHTEAMMLPILHQAGRRCIYCADLIPSSHHIHLPYVMAYDIRPLQTLEEKERLLREAAADGAVLLFEHDPRVQAARVARNAAGKYVLEWRGDWEDVATE